MRLKLGASLLIPAFYTHVLNQFGKSVKAIHTNNALEYNMSQFYSDNRIQLFHPYVETLEQSSKVDRKHQHILHVAQALLF